MPQVDIEARPQRFGIIGVGPAGLQHACAVIACGHKVVMAAAQSSASPRIEAFKKVAPEARIEIGYEALLMDESLDRLVVALPWHATPLLLPKLLAHAKPMLIEKPIGLDAGSIEAALKAPNARTDGKLIGFNRRFYGTAARLRERLTQGGLKAVQITISEDLRRQERAHGPSVIPHLLTFSSAHTLDLARHLLGPLAIVKLYGRPEASVSFVSVNGLLETQSGVPVHLSLNASDPSPAGIRILFDDHTAWSLSPLEMLSVFDRYEIVELRLGSQIRRYMPHMAEFIDEPTDHKPGFVAQMKAFISGDFGPGASLAEALETQRLIDALRVAAEPTAKGSRSS